MMQVKFLLNDYLKHFDKFCFDVVLQLAELQPELLPPQNMTIKIFHLVISLYFVFCFFK